MLTAADIKVGSTYESKGGSQFKVDAIAACGEVSWRQLDFPSRGEASMCGFLSRMAREIRRPKANQK